MIKKTLEILTVIIVGFFSLVFFISLLPNFETSKEIYRSIGLASTLTFILIVFLRIFKIVNTDKINRIGLLSLILIGGVIINSLFWSGDWYTQTVIYRHGHLSNKTIELQTKDDGASGSDHRVIEKTKFLYFIQKVDRIDTASIELPWIRVDEKINELGLK